MTAFSLGEIIGRRKSKVDPDNPTDPVWLVSYDVDDPKANPGRRIGDGSAGFGWAFTEALAASADKLRREQYDSAYDGPHRLQRTHVDVLKAVLSFLDFASGRLFVAFTQIAEKAAVSEATAKAAMPVLEHWGFIGHVRRSEKVEGVEGLARPSRKQASNSYFFDCRRQMPSELWRRFWGRIIFNLKRIGKAAERRAAIFNHSFNEQARQAPRPSMRGLAGDLDRIRRNHFPDAILPWDKRRRTKPESRISIVPGVEG